MIKEHHEKFKLLYPDVPLEPKHHYMIHYAKGFLTINLRRRFTEGN